MRGARSALGALVCAAAAVLFAPGAAAAGGSVWSRARNPDGERRRDLVAEAQSHEVKAQSLGRSRNALDRAEVTVHLAQAAILLEEAGAATSSDLFLRYRLALVYTFQDEHKKAIPLLESIARADPPPSLRAVIFAELGVSYAHLGRIGDEIAAYSEALRVQPVAFERSLLLSNRAEAYMLLGDITAAVEGYRAAVALLSADHMMFGTGSTTLWGLGVALDRSGDLDSGLDAIRLARTYDAQDKHINGPGWFYVPDYDRHWYEALGHWQVARKTDALLSVRVDAYARASASWDEYLASAARDDRWLPLARLRAKQCEKERSAFLRRPGVAIALPPALPLGRPRSRP
jgi:tetratricopeptide (TPR) repeat protein